MESEKQEALFLCVCEIIQSAPKCLTFNEACMFAAYVDAHHIASLILEGRKLHRIFRAFAVSEDGKKIEQLLGRPILRTETLDDLGYLMAFMKRVVHTLDDQCGLLHEEESEEKVATIKLSIEQMQELEKVWSTVRQTILESFLDEVSVEKVGTYLHLRGAALYGEMVEMVGKNGVYLNTHPEHRELLVNIIQAFQ